MIGGQAGSGKGPRRTVAPRARADEGGPDRTGLIIRINAAGNRLPIGSPAACLDLLGRYQRAGLQRVLVWPVKDEVHQLERVAAEIIPQLGRAS